VPRPVDGCSERGSRGLREAPRGPLEELTEVEKPVGARGPAPGDPFAVDC